MRISLEADVTVKKANGEVTLNFRGRKFTDGFTVDALNDVEAWDYFDVQAEDVSEREQKLIAEAFDLDEDGDEEEAPATNGNKNGNGGNGNGGSKKKGSLQSQYKAALESQGWEHSKDTAKYIVMAKGKSTSFIYLGKNGSVRVGKTVSNSGAVSENVKQKILDGKLTSTPRAVQNDAPGNGNGNGSASQNGKAKKETEKQS